MDGRGPSDQSARATDGSRVELLIVATGMSCQPVRLRAGLVVGAYDLPQYLYGGY